SVPPAWEDFKQRNPGWTGELTMGVAYDKFQASLAAGTGPDADFAGFGFLPVAAHKKMVAPPDPYIARDRGNLDPYLGGSRAGALYQGKTYGLPHHSDVRSVYVNQTVLRDSGLDPSRAPETWDDLRTANQRLKRADLQGSIDRLGFDPTWALGGPTALMYFQADGVPLLSGDGSQPGFATPAAVEALRWLADTVGAVGGIDDL